MSRARNSAVPPLPQVITAGGGARPVSLRSRAIGGLGICLAFVPLIAIAGTHREDLSRLRSALAGEGEQVSGPGSVGNSRQAMLVEISKGYAAPGGHPGKNLAPASYINEELARRGMKWRVRNVTGQTAETFEVS